MTITKERMSVMYVLGLTAIALLLGWLVMDAVTGQAREITSQGVSATLPEQWLVDSAGSNSLFSSREPGKLFTAWDPLNPATRYSVSLVPFSAEGGLPASASIRNLQRAQFLTAYRILEQTPVSLEGRDGYKVSYAFVDAAEMNQVPVVYRGVDYYFVEGDQVIIATLESSRSWTTVLPPFQSFAVSLSLGE